MQKENENTLASAISKSLEENAKKAYFFIGNFSFIKCHYNQYHYYSR